MGLSMAASFLVACGGGDGGGGPKNTVATGTFSNMFGFQKVSLTVSADCAHTAGKSYGYTATVTATDPAVGTAATYTASIVDSDYTLQTIGGKQYVVANGSGLVLAVASFTDDGKNAGSATFVNRDGTSDTLTATGVGDLLNAVKSCPGATTMALPAAPNAPLQGEEFLVGGGLIALGILVAGALGYKALDNSDKADQRCKDFQTMASSNCQQPPCSFYSGSAADVTATASAAVAGGKKMIMGMATLNNSCSTACVCPKG
jgi:hypothetical protein